MCRQIQILDCCFHCYVPIFNPKSAPLVRRFLCSESLSRSEGAEDPMNYWARCTSTIQLAVEYNPVRLCPGCNESYQKRRGLISELYWYLTTAKAGKTWLEYLPEAWKHGATPESMWNIWITMCDYGIDPASILAN